jgi:hypothetical protein
MPKDTEVIASITSPETLATYELTMQLRWHNGRLEQLVKVTVRDARTLGPMNQHHQWKVVPTDDRDTSQQFYNAADAYDLDDDPHHRPKNKP